MGPTCTDALVLLFVQQLVGLQQLRCCRCSDLLQCTFSCNSTMAVADMILAACVRWYVTPFLSQFVGQNPTLTSDVNVEVLAVANPCLVIHPRSSCDPVWKHHQS